MKPFLELQNVTKKYGRTRAVDNISLSLGKGRFLTLLGPSGSGKTTVLMAIAGFVDPDAGRIVVDGRDITRLPPERRNFGMVFQGYALFPHLSVRENVAFSLRVKGCSRTDIEQRVKRALDMVRMPQLADRMPKQLSGGQQQRVAIARALVFEPDILLLDEPLSALDKKLRGEVQRELRELHERLGMTFVCVTHDQDEALSIADEVAILRDGKIQQIGSPKSLYEAPATRFVADFLGKSNFLQGKVVASHASGFTYACGPYSFCHAGAASDIRDGDEVHVSLRPEKMTVSTEAPRQDSNRLEGVVVSSSYTGTHDHLLVRSTFGVDFSAVLPTSQSEATPEVGKRVWLSWVPTATVRVSND